ncbi:fimbrillin family protein [Prevotella communis]|uniref:fimbrillin family protein n=1 Tax=Prevotella communis TaxID=2913614 RepID=UPI001EDA839C|nr:fimbrillin family protein [Prevotella communis]UKK67876.1 fimbrillin family protein [Prevotella communis]UKK69988.1 fimbrillin family protein [Prevotella communis]
MKFWINIYIIMALVLAGCTAEQETFDEGLQQIERMPVLFSAGNTDAVITRAASASYMPKNSHFVCSMFFHAGVNDTIGSEFGAPVADVNMTTAWLKISNSTGNAVYWNKAYSEVVKDSLDIYGFDVNSKCFYWQNRLNHIFLALTDNNDLDGSISNSSLKIYPDVTDKYKDKYMLAYDLTRGDKTSMAEQPDPILALETARPSGGTPEANRVKLFFKHQFAQVQVNLKSSLDQSAVIDSAWIERVELLGVAETGYVPYCILSDGTLPAATSLPINVDDNKYQSTIKDNPYGSSFNMFKRSTPVGGYLKSFECIAFGTLQGIRITWRESDAADAVKHVTTYKGVKNLTLKSGTKYIYNMELRRSLIAEVTAKIKPWDMDTANYSADGTIKDDNQN